MKLRKILSPVLCLVALLPAMAAAQTISTVAGNGGTGNTGDGGPATSAEIGYATGVLAAPDGGFYIGGYGIVRRVAANGTISTFAGNGTLGSSGDGGPATSALLHANLAGLALGPDGSLYIADSSNFRVRKVGTDGKISSVVAGEYPVSLGFDQAGNLFIGGACKVLRFSSTGVLTRFAGTGTCGPTAGDGGPATAATLAGNVYGIAVDAAGDVWISDTDAHRIRKVGADGVIVTVDPDLTMPMGLSADNDGNVYAVDLANAAFRYTSSGSRSVVAGALYGASGFSGDGGPATDAQLDRPWGISVANGHLLLADTHNLRIRKVTADVAPIPSMPPTTCASEGYKGTQLTWCKNICENGLSGAALDTWIHRWIQRYRDLP